MEALISNAPVWLGVLGWLLLLVGFLLQKKALVNQTMRTQTSIKGNFNVTNNNSIQSASSPTPGGDSTLSKLGSWASLFGLALSVLPLIKSWLHA